MPRHHLPFAGPEGSLVPTGFGLYPSVWGAYIVDDSGTLTFAADNNILLEGNEFETATLFFENDEDEAAGPTPITAVGIRYTHLQGEVGLQFSYTDPGPGGDADLFMFFNDRESFDGIDYLPAVTVGTVVEATWSLTSGAVTVTFNGGTVSSRVVTVASGGNPFFGIVAQLEYLILGTDDEFMPPGRALLQELWFDAEYLHAPAVRLHPRDDALGMSSAPRHWPLPKSQRIIGRIP